MVEIMVEILSTLALATKQVKQGRLSKSCSRWCEALTQHGTGRIIKKSLRENGIEAVLHRLERLTEEEARATGALTLEIVCGLIRYRRDVMGGEQPVPAMVVAHDEHCGSLDLDDKVSAGNVWGTLGQIFWYNLGGLNFLTCH
jgi:hypothetical protein